MPTLSSFSHACLDVPTVRSTQDAAQAVVEDTEKEVTVRAFPEGK